MVADLDPDTYTFPVHICPTTERPDIVTWNEKTKIVFLIELTVCFDEKLCRCQYEEAGKVPRSQGSSEGCWLQMPPVDSPGWFKRDH